MRFVVRPRRFLVMHAIKTSSAANKLPIPLPIVPLVGGLTDCCSAPLSVGIDPAPQGSAFRMISFGVAEMIASSA